MIYKINWSAKSQNDYFKIIDYILENWGTNSARKFIEIVNHNLKIISIMPKLYPKSQIRNSVRRCLMNKKVSMYYMINESRKEVKIITFYDNRRNEKDLTSVLNEFN